MLATLCQDRLAAGIGAGRGGALFRLGQLSRGERGTIEDVPLARPDPVERVRLEDRDEDRRSRDDDRSAFRVECRHLASLLERQRDESLELRLRAVAREEVAVDALAVVVLEPEIERCERRDRAGDADRLRWLERRKQRVRRGLERGHLLTVALGEANGAERQARPEVVEHELCRAAADVDKERPDRNPAEPTLRQLRLVVAGKKLRREAVAPFDLTEERLPVLCVAHRARRDEQRSLGAERLGRAAVVGERVADACDRDGEEAAARVDAFAEPRDARLAVELPRVAVLYVGDEEARRVRPLVDRRNPHRNTRTQPHCSSTSASAARRTASCAIEPRSLAMLSCGSRVPSPTRSAFAAASSAFAS